MLNSLAAVLIREGHQGDDVTTTSRPARTEGRSVLALRMVACGMAAGGVVACAWHPPSAAPLTGSASSGSASAPTGSGSATSAAAHPTAASPLRATPWATATGFRCPSAEQQVVVDKVAYGDVTGDGVDDAVAVLSCTTASSANPLRIEAFDGSSSPAHPRSIGVLIPFDDPLYVEQVDIAIDGRTIQLSGAGVGPDAALAAGPTVRFTQSFTYRDGRTQPSTRHTSG